MSSDHEKKDDDTATSAEIPEVDAEVVEDGEEAGAEPFDEPEAAAEAADDPSPRRSLVSPGVLVFGGLVVIAVAAGLYWYFAVDKGVVAKPPESAVEAPQISAPDVTEAPGEKISNIDTEEMEIEAPDTSDNASTLAETVSELETPADTIENTANVDDAKSAAIGDGEFAATADDEDVDALSFDLEGEGAGAPNTQLSESERSIPQTESVSTDTTPTDDIPNPDDADIATLPRDNVDDASTESTLETDASIAIRELEVDLATERERAAQLSNELEATQSRLSETMTSLNEAMDELSEAQADIRTLRAENDRLKQARRDAPLADAAIALNTIEKAAAAGENYETALARLKSAAPDIPLSGVLADHAGGGAPTLRDLQGEFDAAARAGLAAANRENADGVVERYRARISGLFNIRPATPQAGDAPSAVISRADNAVRKGALSMAIEEIAALPPAARDEMKPWTERAETRIAIDAALTALNAHIAAKAAQAASL